MQTSGFRDRGAAIQLAQYGDLLIEVGRIEEAEAIYTEGLAIAESVGYSRATASLNLGMAKVYLANTNFGPALEYLGAAEAYVREGEPRPLANGIRTHRAKLHRMTGQLDAAARTIDTLLFDMGYPEARRAAGLNAALAEGVEIFRNSGDYQKADALVNGLIDRLEEKATPDSVGNIHLGKALMQRAKIRLESTDRPGAISDLNLALSHLKYALGNDHPAVVEARHLRDVTEKAE
jgi:tetratricopeptide (TPR) repeat protein